MILAYILMKWLSFKNFVTLFIESIGFDSVQDLFLDTFSFRIKFIGIYVIGVLLSVTIQFFEIISRYNMNLYAYIDLYVYSPAERIYLLLLITIVNFFLGIGKSRMNRIDIDGYKFAKAFIRFTIQVIFIAFLYNLSNTMAEFGLMFIVDVMAMVFILSTFWSAWNNARSLDLITEEQHQVVQSVFDIKNILSKFSVFDNLKSKNPKDPKKKK
jgi:hypothetical protein